MVTRTAKYFQEGFTLIELLCAVVVIGVLSAIALPSYLNQSAKARGSEAKSILGTINRSQQAYRLERGAFASNIATLSREIRLPNSSSYYSYTMAGNQDTAITSADPANTNYKVYEAGVALGLDERFVQIICESIGVKASAQNTAKTNLVTGFTPSANCTSGRIVQ